VGMGQGGQVLGDAVNGLTVDKIREIKDLMDSAVEKPLKVESGLQADEMTAIDPFSRKWSIGDEYYMAYVGGGLTNYIRTREGWKRC